jgi:hypothetical protein
MIIVNKKLIGRDTLANKAGYPAVMPEDIKRRLIKPEDDIGKNVENWEDSGGKAQVCGVT